MTLEETITPKIDQLKKANTLLLELHDDLRYEDPNQANRISEARTHLNIVITKLELVQKVEAQGE